MKQLLFITLITFCVVDVISAQTTSLKFSVKEAVNYALENNKTLKNARDDIKLATEQIKEAKGAGLPKIEGSLDYMTNFNYEFEFNFGGGASEPPKIDQTKLDPGDYEILSYLDQMFGSSESSAIIMSDQSSAKVQVSQLIFSGQYWVGIQMAKLGRSIRETNLVSTGLDIKEQVINSYYLILSTQQLLKVIEGNTKNLQDIYQHTSNLFNNGMAEQTDVDQIKISLSQLQNSKTEMERSLQLSYNMFRYLLGIESRQEIILSDQLNALIENLAKESFQSESFNIALNPGYQLMSTQEEIGSKQIEMQKWAYAPTLVGFYSYTEKLLTGGFDISPRNAAGVTLSIPILEGGTKKSLLNQKKIQLEQIRRSKDLLIEQLNLQDTQLSFEFKTAYENYLTQKENIGVAKRVYQSYQNKFKQGAVSSLDLTQANNNYLQAESNYVSAMMKLLQAKLALNKLYNKI